MILRLLTLDKHRHINIIAVSIVEYNNENTSRLKAINLNTKHTTVPGTMTKIKDPDAQKLFLSGKKILEDLESSDLFANKLDGHTNKGNVKNSNKDWLNQYAAFDISEIVIGPVLGHGGFGIVNEVQDIVLSTNTDNLNARTNMDHVRNPIVVHEEDDTTTESDSENNTNSSKQRRRKAVEGYDYFDSNLARSYVAANVRRRSTLNRGTNNSKPLSRSTNDSSTDTNTAARYAIKRLKSDLNELNRVRGAIDLAIEVRLLSQLHHPNIGKILKYNLFD